MSRSMTTNYASQWPHKNMVHANMLFAEIV